MITLMDQPFYVVHEMYRILILEREARKNAEEDTKKKAEEEERNRGRGGGYTKQLPSPSTDDPMLVPSSDLLEELLEDGDI